VSNSQVDLSWQDNSSDEDEFRIERSVSGGSFTQIATPGPNVTSYSDTGLAAGTYTYRVRACNGGGCSGFSNTATAQVPPPGASMLVFKVQPSDAPSGRDVFPSGFSLFPAVEVEVRDASGNCFSGYGGAITITLGSGPAGASLSGGGPAQPQGCVATFSNLRIQPASSGYTLVASSGSLTPAVTSPFEVTTPGDFDKNGDVDWFDLQRLLAGWGDGTFLPEDIDKNGTVDVVDLGILLSHWTAPSAQTDMATGVGSASATLNGTVGSSQQMNVWFEWSTDPSLEGFSTTSVIPVGPGTNLAVSATLTTLAANTTYYFRVVATDGGGIAKGDVVSFTTSP